MTDRPAISDLQEELIDDFALFDDWMDRYRYIIQMGDALPALSAEEMVDGNLLKGCQSQVWLLRGRSDEGRVQLRGTSDAAIVRGLVALMLRVYDDQPAQDEHLSPTRKNGLASMVSAIMDEARSAL